MTTFRRIRNSRRINSKIKVLIRKIAAASVPGYYDDGKIHLPIVPFEPLNIELKKSDIDLLSSGMYQ